METTAAIDILPLFQAFAEPYRMQVIELLRDRELCACDIANHLEISASKLSFHLKILRQAGLIQGQQEGRWIYYRLNLSQFVVLERYLAEFQQLSPMLPARSCPE